MGLNNNRKSVSYPITAEDLNRLYDVMGKSNSFYEFTAFDDTGVVGHDDL